jgi:hypothetical protein
MRKLKALKVRGVQRKEIRKKRVLEVEKLIFLHVFFSIIPFPLHFKDDF